MESSQEASKKSRVLAPLACVHARLWSLCRVDESALSAGGFLLS